MNGFRRFATANIVPAFFFLVSALLIWKADLSLNQVSSDVSERFFRNLFLVLSLIIPIVAGLGLNFGIVLGAMAGQIGMMTVQNGQIGGLAGIAVAVIISIPIAMLLGYLTGRLFNKTPGREMITGFILGFFANGIYQFMFLILAGPVIPLHAKDVLLPQGMGVRVTINLTTVERSLDDLVNIPLKTVSESGVSVWWGEIPVITALACALLCVGIWWFFRTKLGQDLRAVGQDTHVAQIAGIPVARCRIIAVMLSIVLAGIGQVIFLQNMAVMNTFQSHEQVGFYAIAALLVGGATVSRAHVGNAILGTFLFHLLIVVVAVSGPKLMKSAQIGEYLREFFGYAIIGVTLIIHAWKSRKREDVDQQQSADGSGAAGGG